MSEIRSYSWTPPALVVERSSKKNMTKVMNSLPEHIRDSIPVKVCRDSGKITVLSVYWDEDDKCLYVDVGLNE